MLNLITDAWIPVRCRSGSAVIRPDQIADPDVLGPDWPRPDLNLACLELLVGLVYLAHPPQGKGDRQSPPSADALREALAPLAPAFNLLGDGPLFLQDWEQLEGAQLPCERLFIDSAGDNTAKRNQDLMVRRGRYDELPLPLAAMALYTLQAFAPSGGAGHNTSLRGGGPMVALVRPAKEGLWPLIWANVPRGQPIAQARLNALPWMRPTKTSQPVDKRRPESLPERDNRTRPAPDGPDPVVFFGQPRRLRLVARNGFVTHITQKNYGENYPTSMWRHPLTPYYANGTELLPRHPKPGNFGYRHWRGVILQSDSDRRPSALVQYLRDIRHGHCSLIVAGWAMNNMRPLDFVWSEQPIFRLSREDDEADAAGAVEAAEQASFVLARQVSNGVGESDVKSGAGLRAQEKLFADTQRAFEAMLGRMSLGAAFVPERWIDELRRAAAAIFDAEVTPGLADLGEARRAAAVSARRWLLAAFAGRSPAGKKIFDALGVPTPSAPRKNERKT